MDRFHPARLTSGSYYSISSGYRTTSAPQNGQLYPYPSISLSRELTLKVAQHASHTSVIHLVVNFFHMDMDLFSMIIGFLLSSSSCTEADISLIVFIYSSPFVSPYLFPDDQLANIRCVPGIYHRGRGGCIFELFELLNGPLSAVVKLNPPYF